MLEITIERRLIRVCDENSAYCIKSERLATGFPDRLVLAPGGRFALIELKRPGDTKLRLAQKLWKRRLRRLGFQPLKLYTREAIEEWAVEFFA